MNKKSKLNLEIRLLIYLLILLTMIEIYANSDNSKQLRKKFDKRDYAWNNLKEFFFNLLRKKE